MVVGSGRSEPGRGRRGPRRPRARPRHGRHRRRGAGPRRALGDGCLGSGGGASALARRACLIGGRGSARRGRRLGASAAAVGVRRLGAGIGSAAVGSVGGCRSWLVGAAGVGGHLPPSAAGSRPRARSARWPASSSVASSGCLVSSVKCRYAPWSKVSLQQQRPPRTESVNVRWRSRAASVMVPDAPPGADGNATRIHARYAVVCSEPTKHTITIAGYHPFA